MKKPPLSIQKPESLGRWYIRPLVRVSAVLHDPTVVDAFEFGFLLVVYPNAHPSKHWTNKKQVPHYCITS